MNVQPHRHPFIDDLAEDVVLLSSILRRPLSGRAQVLKAVKAGGSLYANQTQKFLGSIEGRTFFEYEVDLADEKKTTGLVSIDRNEKGEVTHLNITFSPLGSVLSLATGVRDILAADFDSSLFI